METMDSDPVTCSPHSEIWAIEGNGKWYGEKGYRIQERLYFIILVAYKEESGPLKSCKGRALIGVGGEVTGREKSK